MSEYKKLQEWHKEIGLVPGMIFETYETSSTRTIIQVQNDIIYVSGEYYNFNLNIYEFENKYKLIYDPRIQKDSKDSIQKEISKKESELAELKNRLKNLNHIDFEIDKVYQFYFDSGIKYGVYQELQFDSFEKCLNCFGHKYVIENRLDGTYLTFGNNTEKLEYLVEILNDPKLSDLISGKFKISKNLIKKEV